MDTAHVAANPTVIVPVFRGLEATQRCLDALLGTVERDTPVLIVNDATPEASVAALCEARALASNVTLVTHPTNQGFVASVNEAIAATSGDVVLLNSDTVVSPGWLDRLTAAAAANPRAASVTPFSNNATICSYPFFPLPSELPEGLTAGDLDRLVAEANAGQTAEIPTAVGFCMYIRRAAIDEVGLFDETAFGRGYGEENDWCCRASAAGWQHLLAADVFVYHEGGVSFGTDAEPLQRRAIEVLEARYPDYAARVMAFIDADPLAVLRDTIDAARAKVPGQVPLLLSEAARRVEFVRRDARQERTALREDRDQLQRTLEAERDQARAASEQFEAQLATMQGEQARLVAQNREAEKSYAQQLAAASGALDNARTQLSAYEARCEEYERLLSEARESYAEACEQVRTLEASLTAMHEARAALEAQWGLRLQRKLDTIRGKS